MLSSIILLLAIALIIPLRKTQLRLQARRDTKRLQKSSLHLIPPVTGTSARKLGGPYQSAHYTSGTRTVY